MTTATETFSACTDDNVAVLQDVFGTTFTVWETAGADSWERLTETEGLVGFDKGLLEDAARSRKSVCREAEPGEYLLAVPLLAKHQSEVRTIATATLETESPQFLCRLAESSVRELEQQQQIDRLREENDIFLRQVSEDFEELAFLRSMAERLALGRSSHELTQFIQHTLPLLGDATGVESLCFIANDCGEKPFAIQEWNLDEGLESRIVHGVLRRVVELFGDDANSLPVVKNNVLSGEYAEDLPGIRGFILVGLSTAREQHGWLLAVNRKLVSNERSPRSMCQLSQNELGTNEASLINTAAAMLASHAHNLSLLAERESLLVNVVRTLVSAIDSRDPYTCGHSERVARYGRRLAAAVGFGEEACQRLYLTGLLHDIGKIGVKDAVLHKTDELTSEEYAEIQRHPDLGWAILRTLEQLEYVLPGVLHHHEQYDGKGYPDGLAGKETPLDGRLLAVVDAFDAMTSDRPYRQGMPVEKAIGILEAGAEVQWDAELIETFVRILPDILKIRDSYERPPPPARQRGALRRADGALGKSANAIH